MLIVKVCLLSGWKLSYAYHALVATLALELLLWKHYKNISQVCYFSYFRCGYLVTFHSSGTLDARICCHLWLEWCGHSFLVWCGHSGGWWKSLGSRFQTCDLMRHGNPACLLVVFLSGWGVLWSLIASGITSTNNSPHSSWEVNPVWIRNHLHVALGPRGIPQNKTPESGNHARASALCDLARRAATSIVSHHLCDSRAN